MKNMRHDQIIIWICITLLTIQLGCVHLPQCPPEQVRANLGAIGIVSVGTPEVRVDIPAKKGSGKEAGEAAEKVFEDFMIGDGCLGFTLGCLAASVVGVFLLISGAVDEANAAKVREALIQSHIARLRSQERIRDHLFLVAQEETSHDFRLLNVQGPPERGEVDSYDFLEGKGIDTVLEIRVENIGLAGEKMDRLFWHQVVFFLEVRTRLIRLTSNEELYMRTFHHKSGARQCVDLIDSYAQLLREEFDRSCKILAESIVEEVFLVTDLPLGSRREGTRGLQPKYPELRYNFWRTSLEFVEVDSVQPELQWETFPRAEDREADDTGVLSRITDVTYDLKIWKADENDLPGELVYTRKALPAPSHRIETPLPPSTKCLWSIRLRFKMDGHSRVSHWALSRKGGHFRFATPDQ